MRLSMSFNYAGLLTVLKKCFSMFENFPNQKLFRIRKVKDPAKTFNIIRGVSEPRGTQPQKLLTILPLDLLLKEIWPYKNGD